MRPEQQKTIQNAQRKSACLTAVRKAPSPPYGGTLSAFLSTVPLPKGGAGRRSKEPTFRKGFSEKEPGGITFLGFPYSFLYRPCLSGSP